MSSANVRCFPCSLLSLGDLSVRCRGVVGTAGWGHWVGLNVELAGLALRWGGTLIVPHTNLSNLGMCWWCHHQDFAVCVSETHGEFPAGNICFPVILALK